MIIMWGIINLSSDTISYWIALLWIVCHTKEPLMDKCIKKLNGPFWSWARASINILGYIYVLDKALPQVAYGKAECYINLFRCKMVVLM